MFNSYNNIGRWLEEFMGVTDGEIPSSIKQELDGIWLHTTGSACIPAIRKVYINGHHTTIEWADGSKTTVGCMDGEPYSEYAGFAAAVVKKLFGSSSAAARVLQEHKVVTPPKAKKQKSEAGAVGHA